MKKTFSCLIALLLLAGCSSAAPASQAPAPSQSDPVTSTVPSPEVWKPNKAITIILAGSAGGTTDLEVKALQESMEKQLGVGLLCDYQSSAGGTLVLSSMQRAEPDGYTLYYANNPAALLKEMTGATDLKVLEVCDFVCSIAAEYRVLLARADAPFSTVDELIAYSKAGNKASIAFSAIASSSHLQVLQVQDACGIELNGVPMGGNPEGKAAFLGGHVQMWAADVAGSIPLIKSGEAVALAICGEERNPALPDVPTFKELGYDVVIQTIRGFLAPKGLPDNIMERLIEVIKTAANDTAMTEYSKNSGTTIKLMTGEEYRAATEYMVENCGKYLHLFG